VSWNNKPIAFQIMVPSLMLVILGFLAVGTFSAWSKAHSMSEMFRRKVELSAKFSEAGAAGALWQFDEAQLKATLAPILEDPDFAYVIVIDVKGNRFFSSGREKAHDIAVGPRSTARGSRSPF
jgi:hypothetical protein